MNEKKYILTDETHNFSCHTLHRIQAVKDFGNVKAGDLGGWIESEENLSQEGTCWIFDDAKVFGKARVYGEAIVFYKTRVSGEAKVYDRARVYGEVQVYGKARIYGKACVCGEAEVFGKAVITGTTTLRTTAYVQSQYDLLSIENIGSRNGTTTFYKTKEGGIDVACGCFRGSIEEFEKAVEKTDGDNEHGMVYKNVIRCAKSSLKYLPDSDVKMTKIKKGDLVKVNPDFCLSCYSQFAIRPPWYALRWAYRNYPKSDHEYCVIGIHGKGDNSVVVIRDTLCETKKCNPIFFMEITGVYKEE